ncbi:MAG: tetratricopeptide repeat protein, partial [Planctomycetota bacterium]|nr:tetratricopeptide repeat protein [Planctomycetota bacterium]
MGIFRIRLGHVARFTHGLVPGVLALTAALAILADASSVVAQQSRAGAARAGTAKSGVRPAAIGANDLFPAPPLVPQPSLRAAAAAPVNRAAAEVATEEGAVELPPGAAAPGVIGETNPGNVLIKDAWTKSSTAKDEGDFSEIIAMCEEGLKHKPSKENTAYAQRLCAWSYNRRGERFSELGNEAEALKDFTAAISYDGNHWRAIHNRGVSHATLGKINEAMADFTRALQINPAYANTWFNRGELRSDQRDYAKAVTDYTEALRLSPNEGEFYSRRGFAYSRSGNHKQAMSDFNTAIKLKPNDASVRLRRGEIHMT